MGPAVLKLKASWQLVRRPRCCTSWLRLVLWRTFVPVVEDAIEMVMEMPFVCVDSQLPSHSFQGRQSSVSCQLRWSELEVRFLVILYRKQKASCCRCGRDHRGHIARCPAFIPPERAWTSI